MVIAESCMQQTRISLSIWFSLRRNEGCSVPRLFPQWQMHWEYLTSSSGAAVRAVPRSGSTWRCPAQLASSSKCWFNLYMLRFCQDGNLQQKAQSLPLFQAFLISRFSDAPWNDLYSPAVGSWSSFSLLHSPLSPPQWPLMPFFQAFPAQRKSSPELEVWGFHGAEDKAQPHSLSLNSVNWAPRISAQFNYYFVSYPE